METPEQAKDRERLERYILREQLISVMNDSRWRRLIAVLNDLPISCTFRRKDVREPMWEDAQWDSDFHHVFGGSWASIEWIEINAKIEKPRGQLVPPSIDDRTDELQNALRQARVPFTVEHGNTRVWGYTRSGRSLHWESLG